MPEPDSEVVKVLRQFRTRMNALDETLMRDMGLRWLQIERALDREINSLVNEMLRRQAEGEVITQQMIWKSERYQILKSQMQAEIRKYNKDFAAEIIANTQARAALIGIDAAQGALTSSYPSPISAAFNKINLSAVESMIGFAGDGSPLRLLLAKDYPVAVDGLLNALITGLSSGQSSLQIAKAMNNGMGMGMDRAMLIARTETQRAYRMGSVEQYRQSGVVTGFMRLVQKSGACFACLMLDGEEFDVASELDDHPRGRCTAIPIVRGVPPPTWDKGPDWFLNQDEARQRAILGNTRFEMWKNGTPLQSFGHKIHNPIWGASPAVVPIKDLKAGGAVVNVGRMPPNIPPKIVSEIKAGSIPVSNALDISGIKNKEIKSETELALRAIDKVHGDGNLPTIPISQAGAGRNYGTFFASGNTPIKISISPKGDHKALTTIHEIGHLIDHSGMGKGLRWSSELLGGVENNIIVKTARESSWYKGVWSRTKIPINNPAGDAVSYTINKKYVRYLMSSKEVYARAYAQYVAEKSGDSILLSQLKKLQDMPFPTQWSTEDFKPISKQFDKLFTDRGWKK